jgi:site-specific DNA-methyltransferase (adenine-specific)
MTPGEQIKARDAAVDKLVDSYAPLTDSAILVAGNTAIAHAAQRSEQMITPYFQDESCTIYHGDCRDILPQLPKIDLVLTDPPYSIKHTDGGGFAAACFFYREGALEGMTDFVLQDYAAVLAVSVQLVAFHSRDQILEYGQWIRETFGHYDLHFWAKTNAIPFTHNTWKSDLEYIALGWREKHHQPVSQELKNKAYISGIETGQLHPAQKPIELMSKYISVLTTEGQTILDPFMGSGTTLRAAKDLGRRSIGIEIEEKYCAIAVERLRQAVLL